MSLPSVFIFKCHFGKIQNQPPGKPRKHHLGETFELPEVLVSYLCDFFQGSLILLFGNKKSEIRNQGREFKAFKEKKGIKREEKKECKENGRKRKRERK